MQDGPHDSDNGGRRGLAGLQIENSVVWAATILGVAVAGQRGPRMTLQPLRE